MNKVTITPSKEGALVNAYPNNPQFGYVLLSQSNTSFQGGWLRTTTNRAIIKGDTKALEQFVQANPTLQLDGTLIVKEYKESEVPSVMAEQNFDKNKEYEDQIKSYIKSAGEDGPALKADGERILRFTVWDESGTDSNIKVQHDNVEEIKVFNTMKSDSSAELPK